MLQVDTSTSETYATVYVPHLLQGYDREVGVDVGKTYVDNFLTGYD